MPAANTIWRFNGVLTEQGWLEPGYVVTDDRGRIVTLSSQVSEGGVTRIGGFALPGFQNGHSHAFQYAMAGLAEHLPGDRDDFWSWRHAMYRLALGVSPEDLHAIAAMLYAELLRHGFTAVAEFHYLHHDREGNPYADPAAMAGALVEAARETGIRLCLVPIYYKTGDFGKNALPEQRRFISNSVDAYFQLFEASRKAVASYGRGGLGRGVHSLRAAEPNELRAVFAVASKNCPCHLHIAEQRREVQGCLEHLGQTPVAWLLDNVPVDERFHLVHATHVTEAELGGIARSGATVVLCPSTEANLGDGFFPLPAFQAALGSWAIGTDSHIGLSPLEELRWLDYGQRLSLERRNVLCREPGEDSGEVVFRQSWRGGRSVVGQSSDLFFSPGEPFDAVVLDENHPLLSIRGSERRLATLIYGGDASAFLGTIAGGRWVVQNGRHHKHAAILTRFQKTIRGLLPP